MTLMLSLLSQWQRPKSIRILALCCLTESFKYWTKNMETGQKETETNTPKFLLRFFKLIYKLTYWIGRTLIILLFWLPFWLDAKVLNFQTMLSTWSPTGLLGHCILKMKKLLRLYALNINSNWKQSVETSQKYIIRFILEHISNGHHKLYFQKTN